MQKMFTDFFFSPKKEIEKPGNTNLKCPSCGYDGWYEGPGGGSWGNIECGNCHKWYNNMGIFGLEEIHKPL